MPTVWVGRVITVAVPWCPLEMPSLPTSMYLSFRVPPTLPPASEDVYPPILPVFHAYVSASQGILAYLLVDAPDLYVVSVHLFQLQGSRASICAGSVGARALVACICRLVASQFSVPSASPVGHHIRPWGFRFSWTVP